MIVDPKTPLRVMVVDDHPMVRTAIAGMLAGSGMILVAEAASGQEAIETAPRVAPDILLLDVALPDISGIQVVRELAPRLPMTGIIVLSSTASDRDVFAAMRYGARGYLTKDLSAEALVRSLLGTRTGELIMPRRIAARLLGQMSWRPSPGVAEDAATVTEPLTARERDVFRLLADGMGDRDIAVALTISRRTVETHVSSILHKLGVPNRAAAARRYREQA